LAYSTFGLNIKEPDVEIAKVIFDLLIDVMENSKLFKHFQECYRMSSLLDSGMVVVICITGEPSREYIMRFIKKIT